MPIYLSPSGRESDFSILALAKCQKSQERGFAERAYPSLGFSRDLANAKSKKILSPPQGGRYNL
jgi:hypothetical protein